MANVIEIILQGRDRASGPLGNVAKTFKEIPRVAKIATTALVGMTVVSVKMAANFERGVTEIGTLMDGVTKGAIRNMRKELLDLSADSGQAIEVLTKARYDIVSAGFSSAAESALVLNQSVKLATASATTAAAAADILTTALNAYGLEADQTTRVSDVLFNTVKLGKTTMTELAASLGTVLPTARAAGVSIAALEANPEPYQGKNVVVVICGANISRETLKSVL